MKEHSARGAGVVILLVFAAFLIFNIWSSLEEKISYIEASLVTVEEIVSLDTVFIRDQVVIKGKTDNIEYLVANGEKVSVNQAVCIYFKSDEARANYRKLVDIENEIEAIEAVYAMISSGTESIKLDALVYTYLSDIMSDADSGKLAQVRETYHSLEQVIIARDAGLYSKDIFTDRLSELKMQQAEYESLVDRYSETVTTPVSGYFFSDTDGFEARFTTDCLDDVSVVFSGREEQTQSEDDVIGTVVSSFYWYLAAELEEDMLYDLRGRTTMSVQFPELLAKSAEFTVESLAKGSDGKYYMVLKSANMLPKYLSTRFQPMDVVLNTYTGIRVPIQALHQNDGKWGVFCLEGASARFKPAEIIYQTDSYYLLKMADSASNGLYLYDKIIISGKDFRVK
ncbi:MAG: hypothetical protein IKY46_06915 [Clostridia bacterium]|nr:hypothetical protein [Clostridia bacterium]